MTKPINFNDPNCPKSSIFFNPYSSFVGDAGVLVPFQMTLSDLTRLLQAFQMRLRTVHCTVVQIFKADKIPTATEPGADPLQSLRLLLSLVRSSCAELNWTAVRSELQCKRPH